MLLQDFKKLGLKNKILEDELKGKASNPSKRIKLTENSQKKVKKAREELGKQQKQIEFWKGQA